MTQELTLTQEVNKLSHLMGPIYMVLTYEIATVYHKTCKPTSPVKEILPTA